MRSASRSRPSSPPARATAAMTCAAATTTTATSTTATPARSRSATPSPARVTAGYVAQLRRDLAELGFGPMFDYSATEALQPDVRPAPRVGGPRAPALRADAEPRASGRRGQPALLRRPPRAGPEPVPLCRSGLRRGQRRDPRADRAMARRVPALPGRDRGALRPSRLQRPLSRPGGDARQPLARGPDQGGRSGPARLRARLHRPLAPAARERRRRPRPGRPPRDRGAERARPGRSVGQRADARLDGMGGPARDPHRPIVRRAERRGPIDVPHGAHRFRGRVPRLLRLVQRLGRRVLLHWPLPLDYRPAAQARTRHPGRASCLRTSHISTASAATPQRPTRTRSASSAAA